MTPRSYRVHGPNAASLAGLEGPNYPPAPSCRSLLSPIPNSVCSLMVATFLTGHIECLPVLRDGKHVVSIVKRGSRWFGRSRIDSTSSYFPGKSEHLFHRFGRNSRDSSDGHLWSCAAKLLQLVNNRAINSYRAQEARMAR